MTDLFRWGMKDELYYELIKDPETRRPANCEGLVTVETNQEIWELISHKTRTNDEKLQFIETTVVKAATLIAKVVNSLTSVEHESMMAGDVYSESTTAAAENDSVKEKDAVGKYGTLDIDVAKIKAILEKCATVETETIKAKDLMDKCTTIETASAKAGNVIDKSITVETDSTKVKDVIEKSTVVESDSGKGEDVMDKCITVESDSTKVKDVIKKSTVVESDSGKGEDVMDKGITVETDSAKVEDKNGNGSQVDTDSGKVEHVLGSWVPVETDTGPVIGPWVPVEPDPVHNEAVMGKHTMVGHNFGYHEDIMGKCMTALALLGHANRQICLTRKQFLKPELKTSYAKLCHHFIPYTGYLFGDDLNVRAKEEKEKYFQRWRGGKRGGRIASGGFSEVEGRVGIGGVSSNRGGRGAVRGLPSGRGGKGAVRGGPSDRGGRGGSRGQSSHRGRGRGFNPRGKSFFQS